MKTKLISVITIATFLIAINVQAVTFTSSELLQKNSLPTSQIDNKSSESQKEVKNVNDNQIDEGAVDDATASIGDENAQEENNQNVEEDADNNQIDEGTLNDVTDALNTEGKVKSPEEVIALLEKKNIALGDIIKAINHVTGSAIEINKDDNKLESYADAFRTKIENQKEKIQNLHNSLEQLSALYDKVGELEKSIDVQKEAIKSDYKDINAYKKLGEKLDKEGHKDIKVFTSGEQVNFDVQPTIKEGRTIVPIRAIAESLKSKVDWNSADKTVILSKDGVQIKLILGEDIAYVNDKEVKLDVPAEISNGRTMVPVRFVSEAFKSTVKWEPEYQTVVIY